MSMHRLVKSLVDTNWQEDDLVHQDILSLSHWKPYVSASDYAFLLHYAGNVQANKPNDKTLWLCGDFADHLAHDIANYLGARQFIECSALKPSSPKYYVINVLKTPHKSIESM